MNFMENIKFYYLSLFIALGLFVTSCDEDEDDTSNKITITIEEPIDGTTITNCPDGLQHIHIDVEASVENHEIEIILHPEGDVDDKIIDSDLHDHDKLVTFSQDVDLCGYPAGTCFHLEVEACVDHDCEEKVTADVEFCLP